MTCDALQILAQPTFPASSPPPRSSSTHLTSCFIDHLPFPQCSAPSHPCLCTCCPHCLGCLLLWPHCHLSLKDGSDVPAEVKPSQSSWQGCRPMPLLPAPPWKAFITLFHEGRDKEQQLTFTDPLLCARHASAQITSVPPWVNPLRDVLLFPPSPHFTEVGTEAWRGSGNLPRGHPARTWESWALFTTVCPGPKQ